MNLLDFEHDIHQRRRGVSSVEVVVAFTLLSAMLTVSTTLIVKHGRMLQAQRQYRVAMDELSNQIELITALPPAEVEQAVKDLEPSEFAAAQLHGAQLKGELQPADVGKRLVLKIWWDEPQRQAAPVALAAWLLPTDDSETPPSGGDPS